MGWLSSGSSRRARPATAAIIGVLERSRELASLRSLGVSRGQVGSIVTVAAVFVALMLAQIPAVRTVNRLDLAKATKELMS